MQATSTGRSPLLSTRRCCSGALRTETLKCLVLDEADEMLSQGFSEQIYEIFKFLPKDIQVALFSATMPPDVLDLTSKFMREPNRILVKKEVCPPCAPRDVPGSAGPINGGALQRSCPVGVVAPRPHRGNR